MGTSSRWTLSICLMVSIGACSKSARSTGSHDGGARADAAGFRAPDATAGADTGSGTTAPVDGSAAFDAQAGSGIDAATAAADSGKSTGPLANPAPGSKFFVGANFWNIDWEGRGDFFASGVDFATTKNPWRPELLADLAPYHVLRFMDWNLTNDSNNPQAIWSTRKQPTAMQGSPVAFEWQIDLCNRTKKDYWVNIPHEADAQYAGKLATLIHDTLDPSLRVYVEWSNEVWNGSFPQHAYAAQQAQRLGLAGSDAAAAYYVYASVRAYEAFEQVFGKGSPRLVKVLSGQAAWTGPCDAHVAALQDAKINPNGTVPDFYAIAPYFAGTSLSALSTDVTTKISGWVQSDVTCAQKCKLPLISYEGGADSFAASGNGCTTLQHDPGMHDLYGTYLDTLVAAGLTGPFMQYTHTGACWGLKEKTGDSLASSPKYAGVLDWLAAHP